ncbi:MAG: 50S ribosomal protein L32 [Acholeplasmatales bacterium]|nr:50S ribosomal protein L32 [Acholeplasmatales bacterium]
MAVPFRRVSKMKKRMRRSHLALSVPGMITCPSCGELTLAHRVCANCGCYKGKQVVAKKEEAAEEAAK